MYSKEQISAFQIYLLNNLTKKRYTHSLNVANEAVKLARTYNAEIQKAYIAGLLHDICKEMPLSKQKQYVKNSKMNVCDTELRAEPLWHAISGAEVVRQEFKIEDKDILNAIRYHTTARAKMTRLEKIIYLADLISIDRDFKDVNKMRRICYKDLDKAMLEALKFSINDTVSKSNTIPLTTLNAYNYYSQL